MPYKTDSIRLVIRLVRLTQKVKRKLLYIPNKKLDLEPEFFNGKNNLFETKIVFFLTVKSQSDF